MQYSDTFNRTNHWLHCSWKALRHGADIASELYTIMSTSPLADARREASRLYQIVQGVMHDIRVQSLRAPKCPSVAFLPVATIDEETGATTMPTDIITYPDNCTIQQRIALQFAAAEHEYLGSEQPTEEQLADAAIEDKQPATEEHNIEEHHTERDTAIEEQPLSCDVSQDNNDQQEQQPTPAQQAIATIRSRRKKKNN